MFALNHPCVPSILISSVTQPLRPQSRSPAEHRALMNTVHNRNYLISCRTWINVYRNLSCTVRFPASSYNWNWSDRITVTSWWVPFASIQIRTDSYHDTMLTTCQHLFLMNVGDLFRTKTENNCRCSIIIIIIIIITIFIIIIIIIIAISFIFICT